MPTYVPEFFNGDFASTEDAVLWVSEELERISAAFTSPEFEYVQLQVLHAEPERLFEGLLVFADGTNWDPGSGAGLYKYISAVWTKVG